MQAIKSKISIKLIESIYNCSVDQTVKDYCLKAYMNPKQVMKTIKIILKNKQTK